MDKPVFAKIGGVILAGSGVAVLRKAFSIYDSRLFFGLTKKDRGK